MKNTTVFGLTLLLFSCVTPDTEIQTQKTFKIPVLIQDSFTKPIEVFNTNSINQSMSVFIGKSAFCDTYSMTNYYNNNPNYKNDFIDRKELWLSDSLKTDGFELFPDYKKTVIWTNQEDERTFSYYPVYVVNNTPNTKLFKGKSQHVFSIQEALDSNKKWRPIEGRKLFFCGNGFWGLKIHSNEFVALLIPKYEGTFKTKIRIRIEIGDIIYVSTPYEGYINEKQFYFNKDDEYLYKPIVNNKTTEIKHLYLGAIPLEFDN